MYFVNGCGLSLNSNNRYFIINSCRRASRLDVDRTTSAVVSRDVIIFNVTVSIDASGRWVVYGGPGGGILTLQTRFTRKLAFTSVITRVHERTTRRPPIETKCYQKLELRAPVTEEKKKCHIFTLNILFVSSDAFSLYRNVRIFSPPNNIDCEIRVTESPTRFQKAMHN